MAKIRRRKTIQQSTELGLPKEWLRWFRTRPTVIELQHWFDAISHSPYLTLIGIMLAFAVAFSPRISASGSRLLTTVFVFLSWLLSVRMLYLLKRVRAKPTKKKIAALCAIGSLALHGLLGALLVSTSKVAAERPSILGRLIIDSVEGDDITFHFQVENGKVLIRNVEVSFTTTVI